MKENMKKLLEYIDKNRFKNYPIENKGLQMCEEYAKNLYLKMLAVIMHQGKEIIEVQSNFFTRLVAGAKVEQTVQDYMRQALEIEIEDYQKFVEAFQENSIKYRFVVDALLLSGMEGKNDEQKQLIIGLMESLKFQKNEVRYLVQLSKSILMQSREEYDIAEKSRPKQVDFEMFLDYTLLFANVLSDNEDYIYISFPEKTEFKFEREVIRAKKVYLNNLKISLEKNLTFEMIDDARIENCDFIGLLEKEDKKNHYYISLNANKNISFFACGFAEFEGSVILEQSNEEIYFEKCLFENCSSDRKYEFDTDFSIIECTGKEAKERKWRYSSYTIRIYIKDSKFKECRCYYYNKEERYSAKGSVYIISNIPCSVEGCTFMNCISKYRDSSYKWYEQGAYLFPRNTINKNNIIQNSPEFEK